MWSRDYITRTRYRTYGAITARDYQRGSLSGPLLCDVINCIFTKYLLIQAPSSDSKTDVLWEFFIVIDFLEAGC